MGLGVIGVGVGTWSDNGSGKRVHRERVVRVETVGFDHVSLVVVSSEGVHIAEGSQIAEGVDGIDRVGRVSILVFPLRGQMLCHFFVAEIELATVVLSNPVDGFLLEPAIDVNAGPLQDCLFHLVEIVRMQSSHPVLAQYLQFLNLRAALLMQKEPKHFRVNVNDGSVDGWQEGWDLHQFIEDVDVLEDGAFCLELMHHFADGCHYPLLQAEQWEAE